jgi:squalene-hopene/tetraprenyl-beta-curcumene cyclase
VSYSIINIDQAGEKNRERIPSNISPPISAKMGLLTDVLTGKVTADQPSLSSKIDTELLSSQVTHSLSLATTYAYDLMSDGHWCGEVRSNITITAEQIFLYYSLGLDLIADNEAYRCYLLSQQNPDGSWGIAPDYPGDVSTTAEAYLALKLLGVLGNTPEMRRARDFVLGVGGLAKVRCFTRFFLAQFGLFPWDAVPQLPAEFILMPSQSPVNIYRLASWARTMIVPLLVIRHHQPIYALPNGLSAKNGFLDELWLDAENKMVPYGPPLWDTWKNDPIAFAFGAVDRVLYCLGGLRYSPLRHYARQQCVNWILEHQAKSGDWAGISLTMHANVHALLLEGYKIDDPPVRRGIESIERFAWQDQNGKRIQPSISPVWDTVLMTRALYDAGVDSNDDRQRQVIKWLKARQLLGPEGDWRIYNPRLAPGGFCFEYNNAWYPDTDDTAVCILAFISQSPQALESTCVARAANWILGMQNRDDGWAAFDTNNTNTFLNKMPFTTFDLCDPSSSDVTGRILEALGLMIKTARQEHIAPDLLARISEASDRAITYLAKNQEPTGAWYGRWGMNYVYGTSNVLCGLAYFSESSRIVQHLVHPAIQWLKAVQNADGGWGEGFDSYSDPTRAGRGTSTPSQTAWALMGLLTQLPPTDEAIKMGVAYLISSQVRTEDSSSGASWPERKYTGTGFPGQFYLGYTLYPHYFPMMALGRYLKAMKRFGEKQT